MVKVEGMLFFRSTSLWKCLLKLCFVIPRATVKKLEWIGCPTTSKTSDSRMTFSIHTVTYALVYSTQSGPQSTIQFKHLLLSSAIVIFKLFVVYANLGRCDLQRSCFGLKYSLWIGTGAKWLVLRRTNKQTSGLRKHTNQQTSLISVWTVYCVVWPNILSCPRTYVNLSVYTNCKISVYNCKRKKYRIYDK